MPTYEKIGSTVLVNYSPKPRRITASARRRRWLIDAYENASPADRYLIITTIKLLTRREVNDHRSARRALRWQRRYDEQAQRVGAL